MRATTILAAVVVAGCTATTAETTTTTAPVVTTITAPAPATTASNATETSTSTLAPATTTTTLPPEEYTIEAFPVPEGSRPHDVAPAADGGVWYTGQSSGELGWLDPETGETRQIDLGAGARPHGVIVADDGTPWITDGGLNAIVSVDPGTAEVTIYPLPDTTADANLNTAVFDQEGNLWFTGQSGVVGVIDLADTGEMVVYEAPGGSGPYGITVTPTDTVYFASLAGSYVGEVGEAGAIDVLEPPTADQGARRVWTDSMGSVWVSEWDGGNVSRYDPTADAWDTWPLPGDDPAVYAVYVDENDIVWLSDFDANAMVRFDPLTQEFNVYPLPHDPGDVRQIHGRPGEVWGAESAADHLVVIRTR